VGVGVAERTGSSAEEGLDTPLWGESTELDRWRLLVAGVDDVGGVWGWGEGSGTGGTREGLGWVFVAADP